MTLPRRAALALASVVPLALLAMAPGPAGASAPPLPPGCTGSALTAVNATPALVSGGASADPIVSEIEVSGLPEVIRDVDAGTDISHTFSADLDVTLESPEGTVATLTTDNGGSANNLFGNGFVGTLWDDDAGSPITNTLFIGGIPVTSAIPEEAMAAFVGEDPNGTWTLRVGDDAVPDNGQLHRWSLTLSTLNGTPVTTTASATGVAPAGIPNPGSVTRQATIAGAGAYVWDVRLRADIPHLASGDLSLSVRSPSQTSTPLSINNGASFDNVFGDGPLGDPGTLWHDRAGAATADPGGGPVTDAEFVNGVPETTLVPEGAMGAFIGEPADGLWTLTAADGFDGGFGGDNGSIESWGIEVDTVSSCTAVPPNDPPVSAPGGPGTGPGAGDAQQPAARCANPVTGTRRADRLVGTAGGDLIKGNRGADRIRGLAGDDCLRGGGGRDRLRGGPGDDHIRARDRARDLVRCGPGADVAIVSRRDRVRGCETVKRR